MEFDCIINEAYTSSYSIIKKNFYFKIIHSKYINYQSYDYLQFLIKHYEKIYKKINNENKDIKKKNKKQKLSLITPDYFNNNGEFLSMENKHVQFVQSRINFENDFESFLNNRKCTLSQDGMQIVLKNANYKRKVVLKNQNFYMRIYEKYINYIISTTITTRKRINNANLFDDDEDDENSNDENVNISISDNLNNINNINDENEIFNKTIDKIDDDNINDKN